LCAFTAYFVATHGSWSDRAGSPMNPERVVTDKNANQLLDEIRQATIVDDALRWMWKCAWPCLAVG
jgi:hypothetical protein